DGSRRTPDGVLLRWRAADLRPGSAGPGPDSPPLPFLIEWQTDQAGQAWFDDRVNLTKHEVPWGTVHSLLIGTPNAPALVAEYEKLFGWRSVPGPVPTVATAGGDAVNARLGEAAYVVLGGPVPADTPQPFLTFGDAA